MMDKIKIRQPTCPWWFLFTFDNPLRKIYQDRIGLADTADFVLAFWMVHEVHESRFFLAQIYNLLKNNGRLLIAELYFHVSRERFRQIQAQVKDSGFSVMGFPGIGFSRATLAERN